MGYGMIIAGLILLCNPVIHVVDILPDAVGFFLIAAGLTKCSYFVDHIGKAREAYTRLALLNCVKILCIAVIPYTTGSAKVLMALIFGVLELLLFIPGTNALFEGLSFMGLWYGGDSIYSKKVKKYKARVKVGQDENIMDPKTGEKAKYKIVEKTKEREYLTNVKRFLLFFYIFRVGATFIPEMTELQLYDNVGEIKRIGYRLSYYKPALYVVFGLAVIILGIICIVKCTSYFRLIKRDKVLNNALDEKYKRDILPKTTLFIARNMKTALFLFGLSTLCELNLAIDGVNLLVGVVPAALLIGSAAIVGKYIKSARIVIPVAVVRGALSIVNFVLQYLYFGEYSTDAVDWISEAYDSYYRMAAFITVEKLLALAAVLIYLTMLMKAIKAHLEICGIQTDNAMYSKRNHDIEVYNTVGGKLLLLAIFAIVNFAFSAANAYLAPDFDMVLIINTVITIIYIAYTVTTINTINDLLYDKEIKMA